MKKILLILAICFISITSFCQIYDENTGKTYKIESYYIDSVTNIHHVNVVVYREGIDGRLDKVISVTEYQNDVKCYAWLRKDLNIK